MFVDRLSASNRCLQVHQGHTPEHMAADRKPQYNLYASQAIPEPFSSDEPADYRESEILFVGITNQPTHIIDKLSGIHILFVKHKTQFPAL